MAARLNGNAYIEIIIRESPARPTRLAAAGPQTYVAKIPGARLQITAESSVDVPFQIYVGESQHGAKLGVPAERLEAAELGNERKRPLAKSNPANHKDSAGQYAATVHWMALISQTADLSFQYDWRLSVENT